MIRGYASTRRASGELTDLRHSPSDTRHIARELTAALEDEHHNVRRAVSFALSELGGPATVAVPSLIRALADPQLDGLAEVGGSMRRGPRTWRRRR
jgi:HEAT repeat protein